MAAIDSITTTQWYATEDTVPLDKVFVIAAHDGWPELWIVHSSMLPSLAHQAGPHVRLRHIRDWQPKPGDFPMPIIEYTPDPPQPMFMLRRYWGGIKR